MKMISGLADRGVSLAKPRVALFAASPRADYRAVGFPLQSLTRNAALVVFLSLVSHSLSAQFFKPYRFMPQELLREKQVKCIAVYSEKPSGRSKSQELCFDELGQLLQVLTFWGEPIQADTERYVYDETGKELFYTSVRSMADGFSAIGEPLMKWTSVIYNSQYEQGRLVKYIGNEGAYLMSGSHYTDLRYDSLGKVVERTYHDTVAHEIQRAVSIYDKNGREILHLNYDARNEVTAFEVTSYDMHGRKTDSELRNAGKYSAYRTKTRYYYDLFGRLVKEERFDDGKPDSVIHEYRYDASGLLTKIDSNIMIDYFEYTFH